ncbi:MAG: hypothetical protein K9H26_06630 [Prolixibacteraceae bacterium]|nr:hypothetical protein [Prolixibacteraceae bacterium]
MRNLFINWFALLLLLLFASNNAFSISFGNFKSYRQVTDKQIVIESTSGIKVLFNALDNNELSITIYEPDEKVQLLSPAVIMENELLKGSIYVEELDDLMQITTTTDDGLIVKIQKYPLGFSYCNKLTHEPFTSISNKFLLRGKSCKLSIVPPSDEDIDIVMQNNDETSCIKLDKGGSINASCNNSACYLFSSKGYALRFENQALLAISQTKSGNYSIDINKNENNPYRFVLIVGPEREHIDKELVYTGM